MHPLTELELRLRDPELDSRVLQVLEYARSNLTHDLSLSRIASQSNVCIWHICRLFRKDLGMSPSRCVKLLRMRSAAELLDKTHLSVKQVMARVGFNDESHFVRDFKIVFGESPTHYRKRTRIRD